MKKLLLAVTAAVMLTGCGSASNTASAKTPTPAVETASTENRNELHTMEFPNTGFSFTVPIDLRGTKGMIAMPTDRGEYEIGSGVVWGSLQYLAHTTEEYNEYQKKCAEAKEDDSRLDPADVEMIETFMRPMLPMFLVIGVNGNRVFEDISADFLLDKADRYGSASEIGENNGYKYYFLPMNLDHSEVRETFDLFPDDLKKEYTELVHDFQSHPEYFSLSGPTASFAYAKPGTTVKFEAKDLDGNTVKSEELFARNAYTMVCIWRTWCQSCVKEFPAVQALAQEYGEKGIGVVTFCADASQPEIIEQAKAIVSQYGFTADLAASEQINAALPWDATPYTYFVDREGKVAAVPIIGAEPEKYRSTMEALLSSSETPASSEPAASNTEKEHTYSVQVTDQNGDPVKGAVVSFCSDLSCNVAETNENGIATFTGPVYPYHVQFIQVPSGYSFDKEFAASMDDDSSTVTVKIQKE